MEIKRIGFITSDGKKHIGYYAPIVNPCGDILEENSFTQAYKDEYGVVFKDVVSEFQISDMEIYYWNTKKEGYVLYENPKESSIDEKTAVLFSKDIVSSDKPCYDLIREWLIINTDCSSAVYIDKHFFIQTEGELHIAEEAVKDIPDYIKIKKK